MQSIGPNEIKFKLQIIQMICERSNKNNKKNVQKSADKWITQMVYLHNVMNCKSHAICKYFL